MIQSTNLAKEDAAIVGQVLVVEVNVLLHRENLKMLWGVPGMVMMMIDVPGMISLSS